jgi:uncharacterized protein YycO
MLTPYNMCMENSKEKEHHDNYFCSELVAHAYKTMGLLPDTTSSTRYFPVSFSEQKGLALQADASLDVIIPYHTISYHIISSHPLTVTEMDGIE